MSYSFLVSPYWIARAKVRKKFELCKKNLNKLHKKSRKRRGEPPPSIRTHLPPIPIRRPYREFIPIFIKQNHPKGKMSKPLGVENNSNMAEIQRKDTTFSDSPCICRKNFITLHRNRRETRMQMARPRLRQDTYNHFVVAPCKVRSSYQARGKFCYYGTQNQRHLYSD